MIGRLLPLAALALLVGCATLSPEARVQAKLEQAGLKPRLARCMADRLVRKLSSPELKQLGHAATLLHRNAGDLPVGELVDRLRALNDPHIVSVVTRAGVGCAIAG